MTDLTIPHRDLEESNIPAKWANVPNELKERKQWVLWKLTTRKDKLTKVPFQTNGHEADSTKILTWNSYKKVVEAYIESLGRFNGIGYVFSMDDPYVGTDIDHCINEQRILTDNAKKVVQCHNSYTEISQGGLGLHVISKGRKLGSRCKKDPYEMYDQKRFFALTGDHLSGTPLIITENQAGLDEVYRFIFPEDKPKDKKESVAKPTVSPGGLDLSEQDIIRIATAAKNGALFKSLYSGDFQGYPSQSEADQAFCNLVAFYTKDFVQIDQIVKSSGLYRKKWDRQDYKTVTINKAISDSTGSYARKRDPKKPRLSIVPPQGGEIREIETEGLKKPDIYEWQRQDLMKEGYTINAFGELYGTTFDKKGNPQLVRLAKFVAWPISQVTTDDGAEPKINFEIEGILAGGKKLSPAAVSYDDFFKMNWPAKTWGLEANILPGASIKDKVRHATQCLSRNLKRKTIFTHVGWRKVNDKWVYLHSGGAIGDSSIVVDMTQQGLSRYGLPEKSEDIKVTVMESMQILKVAPNSVTFPLFGLAYLAPLCEPLRAAGIEPAFVLWMNGLTGSLKSTIAALFLSYFGDFTGKTLPASFKDTANAIELKSFLIKDSILVVDDFHPSASIKETNTMESIAQQVLRGYGDRVGRTRMTVDATLKATYIPRGLCVVTGEDAPNAGQSTTARYLELVLSKGEINFDILNKLQANTKVLGQTMRSYIESIDLETLPKKLHSMYLELRERATKSGQHGRIPETITWLHLGIGMGLAHAVAVGAITEQEKATMLETGWNTLMKLADKQASSVDTEQPAKQFISALSEMLSGGSVYTSERTEEKPIGDLNFIGWHDKDYYYLLPTITYNALTKHYSAHGGHFSVGALTLWRHLEQADAIVIEKGSNQTRRLIKKVVGGNRISILQVKKISLELG